MKTTCFLSLLLPCLVFAQDDNLDTNVGRGLDQAQRVEELRSDANRSVTVIAATIAPEEIDRAVLNRLMQEIARSPEVAKRRLGIDSDELQDIFITISNARGFINGSEMSNVRAMCRAWNSSTLSGDARIGEALDAYKYREQLTRNFIAKYYAVVIADIESFLSEPAKVSFHAYMDDRRRRMANAGAASWGSIVQNISNGSDTVKFHCRDQS